MFEGMITILSVAGTMIAYFIATWLYRKVPTPLFLPVAVATMIVIVGLLVADISYEDYMIGAKWIDAFLGPAVVALAYPLYQNRVILKQLAVPILCGTFIGSLTGITTGIFFTKIGGFDEVIIYSITPKSVTTPVAMDISHSLTGVSSLAAVFVMIAGISGAMMCTVIFRLFHLQSRVGAGVALGSASHAIGTAKALEFSSEHGSISTIAMIICAVFVSILAPLLVGLMM